MASACAAVQCKKEQTHIRSFHQLGTTAQAKAMLLRELFRFNINKRRDKSRLYKDTEGYSRIGQQRRLKPATPFVMLLHTRLSVFITRSILSHTNPHNTLPCPDRT